MRAAIAEYQFPTHPQRQHPQRHLTLVPESESQVLSAGDAVPALHITRRGRLARTVAIAVTIAVLAVAAVMMVLPASAAIEVKVQRGQTLSEIAATYLPDMPLDRAIVIVQLENNLNSTQIQTGQRLLIP